MTTSPFATVVLMVSSLNGKRPLQLTLVGTLYSQ
ncbi:MAG: hypothetical protein CM15mP80_05240 [Alphaproteobacteria bacterium]|nr:MAG: hypothetical protein CM15mP80_05240 [Alphaproteobacteria bacterium]